MTPYRRASSQKVAGSCAVVSARRAPPATAPPMLVSRLEGWCSGVTLKTVSASDSAADEAVPKADSAQRRFVMRLARVPSPSPVKSTKARSLARPGFGRYQAGSSTASGSIRSRSVSSAPRSRGCPPPPRTKVCTGRTPLARSACSGSATIRPMRPRSASRATSPSGRSSTATAPRRFSAATIASALGRVSISSPTWSPWCTPTETSPRTTLSTRSLTSRWRCARPSKRKNTSSGARRACSSSSRPSETRVCGWICSRRARRGSWVVASRASSTAPRTVRAAVEPSVRAMPVPTPATSSAP